MEWAWAFDWDLVREGLGFWVELSRVGLGPIMWSLVRDGLGYVCGAQGGEGSSYFGGA